MTAYDSSRVQFLQILFIFFDLRIFPTCVMIQYTGNLYTGRIISIKIIIINLSIEIRF